MKEGSLLFFVLIILGVFAKLQAQELPKLTIRADSVDTLRINPDQLPGDYESELFDSVKLIFLETVPESEFKDIDRLFITNEHYIIYEARTLKIFVFKKNGSFQSSISLSKQIGLRSGIFFNLYLDKVRGFICVMDPVQKKIFSFDYQGKLLDGSVGLELERLNFIDRLQVDGFFFDFSYYRSFEDLRYFPWLLRTDFQNKKDSIEMFQDFNADYSINDINSTLRVFSETKDGRTFLTHCYDFGIYEINPDGSLNKRMEIVLPANHVVPKDFLVNQLYNGKRNSYVLKHNGLVTHIKYCYSYKDHWIIGLFNNSTIYFNQCTSELINLSQVKAIDINESYHKIHGMEENALLTEVSFTSLMFNKELQDRYKKTQIEIAKLDEKYGKGKGLESYWKYLSAMAKMPAKINSERLLEIQKMKFHNPILRISYLKERK